MARTKFTTVTISPRGNEIFTILSVGWTVLNIHPGGKSFFVLILNCLTNDDVVAITADSENLVMA